jgi:hypothetical protein
MSWPLHLDAVLKVGWPLTLHLECLMLLLPNAVTVQVPFEEVHHSIVLDPNYALASSAIQTLQ